MGLDLFDFDFTEENEDLMTDERVFEQLEVLQNLFKEHNNGYYMRISDLPRGMVLYLDEFEKRGWIEYRDSNAINLLDDYLKYHTLEEVAYAFQSRIDRALNNPNVSWYETVLPIMSSGVIPIRCKNKDIEEEMRKIENEIRVEAAISLGLDHFLEVPSSRGMKMHPFSSKWSAENVLPLIAESIIPITDYNEMNSFFRENVLFFGRRDWDRDGIRNDYDIPPYPEFRRLLPCTFSIACLCEATDIETIKLILDYSGSSYGNYEKRTDLNILYPDGWSMERYESSLTDEDKELIRLDQERLKRLHSHKYV